MPEFLTLLPPPEAMKKWLQEVAVKINSEELHTQSALKRVTASPIYAPHPLPTFARSTVDGYAVIAADTHGVSESLPTYLNLVGEVPMGGAPQFELKLTQCGLIHTGGMLPEGADAVVMVEHTQEARTKEIEILRAAAVGENVLQVGEDVAENELIIPSGTRLRPAEIGGLMAMGITKVQVSSKPRVGIISSGDEVVPPEAEISIGQVRDINSHTLGALVEGFGGQPISYGIVPDKFEELQKTASRALAECDAIVITAGSSASTRDLTASVIDTLGEPGVLVHGVNVRPGKPTILGVCTGKAVIGLPGNPVSALLIARIFIKALLDMLVGLDANNLVEFTPAKLSINLASQSGREDWIPVRLQQEDGGFTAEPVFGKSNFIFTLARAHGLIRIPPEVTGLNAGEIVEVYGM